MTILVKDVTVKYKNKITLDSINLIFKPEQYWAIYGPNGAGKSTLLKTIIGLIRPDSGNISYQNLLHAEIAYLPQKTDIDFSQPISVYELVALGLWYQISFYKGISQAQHQSILTAIAAVKMEDYARQNIAELSQGQLQRVLFARILVQNAKYLLLDEPFNAMDSNTITILLNALQTYKEVGKSIIAIIHDFDLIEQFFPYIVLLNKKVIYQGLTVNSSVQSNAELISLD